LVVGYWLLVIGKNHKPTKARSDHTKAARRVFRRAAYSDEK
jgi:hypothetical protein